tara:strand:+ start:391 stop:756 length:366 start_codon:yes stop_codon:yes gene_type:complete
MRLQLVLVVLVQHLATRRVPMAQTQFLIRLQVLEAVVVLVRAQVLGQEQTVDQEAVVVQMVRHPEDQVIHLLLLLLREMMEAQGLLLIRITEEVAAVVLVVLVEMRQDRQAVLVDQELHRV